MAVKQAQAEPRADCSAAVLQLLGEGGHGCGLGREKGREGRRGRHAKVSECGASCGGGRPLGRSGQAVKQAVAHVRRCAYVRVIKKVGG